ncbi:MAG TPA: Spy/CpxP family protein refolding chaperone [Noviherbaspirillum sp.]|nr:Spy/CpxP family protein refolding chaperone [Noviherbaspirillum sp.]
MTTIRKQLLIGITALGLGMGSLAVHAQPSGAPGDRQAKIERMHERMQQKTEELRAKLNLTPQQEPAWNAYVAAMTPKQGERPARPSREEMAKLTAPERMDRMHAMMQRAEQAMAVRAKATRDFYAVLTPEQRKVFDENFHMGRGHHGKKGMPRG